MRDNRRVSDDEGSLPRKAFARSARLAALPLGYAGRSAIGPRQADRRSPGRGRARRGPAAHRRAAVPHARGAQGRRDEGRPGRCRSSSPRSRRSWVAPYRDQLTALQDSAPPMPTRPCATSSSGELGPGWTRPAGRVRPDAGRGGFDRPGAPGHAGRMGARWRSRCSTRAPTEALMSDLRQIARLAKTVGTMVPGIDVKPLVAELIDRARRGARLRARGRGAAHVRRGVPRRPRHRRAGRRRARRAGCWSRSGWTAPARSRPSSATAPRPSATTTASCSCGSCSPARRAPACCTPTRTRATSG